MPSFQDSAVIFLIALLIFGPKKLPELARYVGKLMNEFRRASAEFRMQMDDEFRQIEQTERQQKLAAIEAAAPAAPAISPAIDTEAPSPAQPSETDELQPEHIPEVPTMLQPGTAAIAEAEPLPIASAGDLDMMPPATGLPTPRISVGNRDLAGMFNSIPQSPDPAAAPQEHTEATHG
jgi:sec-independent protein translocase protein TatB